MAPDDMPRIDLDPQLAERLIGGRTEDTADLPPGAAEVVRVLDAVRRSATERDDSRMAATVTAMRDVLVPGGATPAPMPAPARRRAPSPLPRAMAAGAAGLFVLFGGLAAAGALPAAAQKPVADLASHVGIDLPRPGGADNNSQNPAATPTTSTSTTSTTLPTGDTTPTTSPTSETTVTAPACPAPSYEGPNGCVTPLPVPEPPTTAPPPPTTTTAPPPPPTTTTSTTAPASGGSTGGHGRGDVP